MAHRKSTYFSIKIAQFLMKVVGLWYTETPKERRILNGILIYTMLAIGVALVIEGRDLYYSWGDFYATTYTACSAMPVIIILLKLTIFLSHRDHLMKLIKYTQDNFWFAKYNEYDKNILRDNNRQGIVLMCSFTFFVKVVVVTYMLAPIVENVGKNETDRILPFKLWVDFPTTETPYFETLFVVETLSLIHSGVCFCCFDNFLCLLNIHTAGQFKMLQHKLETIFVDDKSPDPEKTIYRRYVECVHQHHNLIWYTAQLEKMFSYSMLCQSLISGVLLCVAGFQVFLGRGTFVRQLIFIAHTFGCLFQIFVITLTANEVIVHSRAVGSAAYNTGWHLISYEKSKDLRRGIMIMMIRSNRPCCITAGNFFPVSLETFMGVLSTSASYFALLRNLNEETDG